MSVESRAWLVQDLTSARECIQRHDYSTAYDWMRCVLSEANRLRDNALKSRCMAAMSYLRTCIREQQVAA